MSTKSSTPWPVATIGDVAEVNPRQARLARPAPNTLVSFVPMSAVSEVSASITERVERPFSEVSRGYTAFKDNDVIFAKITPCMENGKIAIARDLRNGLGFGSTEFHVIRASDCVIPEFLWYFMRTQQFRDGAKARMVGAAGQQRVPADYLAATQLPLPPLPEQHRIVEFLDQADTLRRQRREADEVSKRILPALFQEMFGDLNSIQQRWPAKGITEVCWPRQWPTISGKQLLPDGYPVFGANGLIGYYNSFNHERPTIAITCRGATCGTINLTPPKCYITGNAMALDDLDESLVTQEFMIAFLECRGLQDVITGAAQPQITRTNLEKVKVPLVPTDLLTRFSEASKSLTSARSNASTSSAILETLFQTLLHRAFDGNLTAKWRKGEGKELLREMNR